MEVVHVFVSTGRFGSFEEMRAFVEETYTEDGDGIDSAFGAEVGLEQYEPMCIECVYSPSPVPLGELLAGASHAETWLPKLDGARLVGEAIYVFPPNKLAKPEASSLEYLGAFEFQVVHPEWFLKILDDMTVARSEGDVEPSR